jgi:hypothetical protein
MVATGATRKIEGRDSTGPAEEFPTLNRRTDGRPADVSDLAGQQRTARHTSHRAWLRRLWPLPAAVLALTLGASGVSQSQRVELAPSSSCDQIVRAIKRLAAAEHRQAQALQLMAKGGDTAWVEGKFQNLLERKRELSFTLKRISMDPVASDPGVNRCLSNGYQALYQSDRLSANIERILMATRLRSQSGPASPQIGRPPAATP